MADLNKVISDNTGLVWQQLHRFKLANEPDAESVAFEALFKAADTYDESSGTAFSTYATCVIANSIRMYLRSVNKKRQLLVVSYNAPAFPGSEDDTTELVDVLVGPYNAEDTVLAKELRGRIAAGLRAAYSELTTDNHRRVFNAWKDSYFKASQSDIARQVGVSQATVNRVVSIVRYKLRQQLEDYL
jgi:RNA polymerase sigma factor (sigma-70 family)